MHLSEWGKIYRKGNKISAITVSCGSQDIGHVQHSNYSLLKSEYSIDLIQVIHTINKYHTASH